VGIVNPSALAVARLMTEFGRLYKLEESAGFSPPTVEIDPVN
jgi:hypothetical protein